MKPINLLKLPSYELRTLARMASLVTEFLDLEYNIEVTGFGYKDSRLKYLKGPFIESIMAMRQDTTLMPDQINAHGYPEFCLRVKTFIKQCEADYTLLQKYRGIIHQGTAESYTEYVLRLRKEAGK